MSRNTARKSTTVDKITLKALIKEAMDERDESKSDETEEKEGGEDILDIVAAALESADAKRKARKDDGEDVGELTPEEVLEEVAALMEEEKSDDEDDEEKTDQEEEDSKRKSARRPSATKRRAPVVVDRKYSSFYGDAMKPPVMNHAAEGERKGMNFARSIKCQYLAMLNRTTAGEIADYLYKGTDVARQLKAMNVSNPIAGGFFVPEAYANEIIPLLHAQAVISALGATRIDMPNGNMNIPKIKGGAMAYYSGELRPIKESQPTIGNVRLTAKKLTALVPMSSELLMSAAYSNDEMFLNDLIQAITLQMDYAGLFGKGGEYEPLGLMNIKGVRKENYNGPIDADTPAYLIAKLMRAKVPMRSVGWTFNADAWSELYNMRTTTGHFIYRDEMNTGKLLSYPFLRSEQIPTDKDGKTTLILGDWSEFIIGIQSEFRTEMFDQGTMQLPDGKILSAMSQDLKFARVIGMHDFAVRHEESFVIAENVQTKIA